MRLGNFMKPSGERFPEIRAADLRAIQRLTGRLLEADDLTQLGREMIHESRRILPADFMVWNIWTLEMSHMLSAEANCHQYLARLEASGEALESTIGHHPIIAAGRLEAAKIRPERMSDYQSAGSFRENPLYRDVYSQVDSRYQIAYNALRLSNSQVILSWNRGSRDFTDREIQLLHLLGLQVAALGRRLEERRHLNELSGELTEALRGSSDGSLADPFASLLGPSDGRLLAALVRGETRVAIAADLGWRRDTLDRHLAGLRDRLGYENTPQMLHALAELKPERAAAKLNGIGPA
jgi:hypothetical protein